MKSGRVALAILITGLTACLVPVAGGASRADLESANYIVMLASGVDPAQHAKKKGVAPEHTYRTVFRGYSAQLSQAQVDSLRQDVEVKSVHVSRSYQFSEAQAALGGAAKTPPQVPSINLVRVGGLLSPTAKIDGIDERVDVDVRSSIPASSRTTPTSMSWAVRTASSRGNQPTGRIETATAP